MGNRKERLGVTKLVRKKAGNANGNRKERLGVTKLVRKKAENANGEP